MTHATRLWSVWQALLKSFAWAFTRPGFRRFAEWVTALAINPEEHTVTQSVTAIERLADWKAVENFAEYGSWRTDSVTTALTHLAEAGVNLPLLMAKSGHHHLRSLQRYARPGGEAVAAMTAAHDPARRRR